VALLGDAFSSQHLEAIKSLRTAKLIPVRVANNHPVPDPRAPRNEDAVAEEAAIYSRSATVEATIASVMAVNEPGLSRQSDSAPAVARDENRPRSNLRPASVQTSNARVVAIDEHVRLSAGPDPATTSLAESVCWHDPRDRDDRYD